MGKGEADWVAAMSGSRGSFGQFKRERGDAVMDS